MGKRESAPEVNAGSMADIAFLLLIFFLVTTTIETDVGLNRKLPEFDGEVIEHHQRNILTILLNHQGSLMIKGEATSFDDLKQKAIEFIDNGGGDDTKSYCDYCRGAKSTTSSDNPQSAIIVFNTQRETEYGVYIAAQNELVSAYNTLRNREANRLYATDYTLMEDQYENPRTSIEQRQTLLEKIKNIRSMFPLNISEAELKNQ